LVSYCKRAIISTLLADFSCSHICFCQIGPKKLGFLLQCTVLVKYIVQYKYYNVHVQCTVSTYICRWKQNAKDTLLTLFKSVSRYTFEERQNGIVYIPSKSAKSVNFFRKRPIFND